ncbi:MAG TPA: amidase family protein, partial [Candidatus Dormibacteraeota bacterium]
IDALYDDILMWEIWQVHGPRWRSDPQHFGEETGRLVEAAASATEERHGAAISRRDQLLPGLDATLPGLDLLVTPAAPFVAPATTPPMDTPEGEAEGRFTKVFNLTGAPALVLPCGWTRDGLPTSLQLVGRRGEDGALLAAAALVEAVLDVPRREPVTG